MTTDPDMPRRRSIRLPGYDYSKSGAYFVTICTQGKTCLFGAVDEKNMVLNAYGQIVTNTWCDLSNHYRHVELDHFVVMPNHIHGIVILNDDNVIPTPVGAGLKPAPTQNPSPTKSSAAPRHALPEVIRGFKTFSSRRINQRRSYPGAKLWQRSYYEHVIRNETDLNRIRQYIIDNPVQWDTDRENPQALNFTNDS